MATKPSARRPRSEWTDVRNPPNLVAKDWFSCGCDCETGIILERCCDGYGLPETIVATLDQVGVIPPGPDTSGGEEPGPGDGAQITLEFDPDVLYWHGSTDVCGNEFYIELRCPPVLPAPLLLGCNDFWIYVRWGGGPAGSSSSGFSDCDPEEFYLDTLGPSVCECDPLYMLFENVGFTGSCCPGAYSALPTDIIFTA